MQADKKQDFFTAFPPAKEELKCLGGSATRFYDILEKLQVKDGFDSAIAASLSPTLSQMLEMVKPYVGRGNQVHILPCLKYIFGLAQE